MGIVTATLLLYIITLINVVQSQNGSCNHFHGCCNASTFVSCLGDPASSLCYCDQICYQFNDCCNDIANSGCLAPSNVTLDKGKCASQGYTGCCDPNTNGNCLGSDGTCYCDHDCYFYGDCCADITSIGCFANSSNPANHSGSCIAAGFSSCCSQANSADCHGNPPSCFCDEICYEFNDCCSDISSICTAATTTPHVGNGTCAGMGYHKCCIPGTDSISCHGSDGICYCDKNCYSFGDCCQDIDQIGCTAPAQNETASCKSAGYTECCNPQGSQICWGTGGKCYCDEQCYSFGDCCADIADIGCIAPSTTPTAAQGSCIETGHITCCVPSINTTCLGSNGICSCSADCYDSGTCCHDINLLACTIPTSVPTSGSCVVAGYTQCCTQNQQSGVTCQGNPPTCFCDASCYIFGDCCHDVSSIGCKNNTVASSGSCIKAGYTSCCTLNITSGEFCVGTGSCYCDEICHTFGDCCNDIEDIGCYKNQYGSCKKAGYSSCCIGINETCVGAPTDNCFCDQACSLRGDCCPDKINLKDCTEPHVPGPVTNLKVMSSSDTSFKITWDKPNKPNGVSHYIVIVANYSGEGDIKTRIQLAIDVTKENVDNLLPYKPYNVTVYGVNIDGKGVNTTLINFTKEGVPIKTPDNLQVSRSGSLLFVKWSPLSIEDARGFITNYQLQYFPSTDSTQVTTTYTTKTAINISNVDPRQRYGLRVAGVTKAGVGTISKTIYEPGLSNPKTSINIALIIGSILGGVGGLALLIFIVLAVLLILYTTKRRKSSGIRYQKLLIQANSDYDDDDDDS